MNTRIDYPFIVLTKRKLIEKGKTNNEKKNMKKNIWQGQT